jgi:4-amino-4-deoxy-L-arabinose transferase-like glycosyltransferase
MIAAGLLLGLYVYRVLLIPHPPLSADEAGHALPAARMAIALREGNLRGFLEATQREVVWPFLHPWVVTPFFLACGISARVARLASLVTFGVGLTLLPALARELARGSDREDGAHRESSSPALLGWLSAALLVTATTWELVCTVMSEALGMALTLAVLLAEARAARRQRISGYLVCGVLVAATFFTKYSYGLPLMAAILLSLAWRGRRGAWAPFVAALAGMAVPIAVWLAWILFPDPRRATELLGAFVNRDEGLHGLADLSFYPAAAASALGKPAALVTLLLLAAALARGPWQRRLPARLFVGVALLMLTLHPNKQVRYLFAALPVVLILAETELADRLRRLRGRGALWAALVVIVLVARNPLVEIREAAASAAPFEQARPILAYAEEHVSDRQPVLFLGTTGLLPHLALTWQLLEREQREPAVDLLLFPRPGDAEGAYRTGYPAQAGPEYGAALEKALASGRFRSVVTLELGPASPFLPDWLAKWDAFGQNYVRAMTERENTADYTLESERAFPASDAKVRIYVRRDSQPRGSDLARSTGRAD